MKYLRKNLKHIAFALIFLMMLSVLSVPVFAEQGYESAAEQGYESAAEQGYESAAEAVQQDTSGAKAIAAAIAVGLAAAAGAIGMGIAIAKAVDGISRQPEAEGKIRTSLMLGLVFVETAIIYALIIAVLIIFVL